MLVYQTNPVGVELFSYVNTFVCFNKFAWLLPRERKCYRVTVSVRIISIA